MPPFSKIVFEKSLISFTNSKRGIKKAITLLYLKQTAFYERSYIYKCIHDIIENFLEIEDKSLI